MLGQLVCIDRRYQRMNCFNVREIQTILKNKFFNEMLHSYDFHQKLNETALILKYKNNDLNTVNSNFHAVLNFNLTTNNKNTFIDLNGATRVNFAHKIYLELLSTFNYYFIDCS